MLVGDPLYHAGSCPDVEAPGGADSHATDMGSGLFPGGHRGTDQIAGGEAKMGFLSGQRPSRKPEGVEPCPLVGSPSGGLDRKNRTLPPGDPVHDSDARRVETMGHGFSWSIRACRTSFQDPPFMAGWLTIARTLLCSRQP